MIYPAIRIEGAILSSELLDHIDDLPGQRPADFGLDSSSKVKDEIARAWADAQDYWRIFQRKIESLPAGNPATPETRNLLMVPLLGLLGYPMEFQSKGTEVGGKTFPISHRLSIRGQTAVHIIGYGEPSGLDRKPDNRRISAHAMVQEFLNLSDQQLYAIVTNGHLLRLLRDSSRLIKLSYLEFDLDRIFSDGLFADFAVLYRLLHLSRLPASLDSVEESLLERYHQDSMDSGARIRDGLSRAVKESILSLGNGFLSHPENEKLREAIISGKIQPSSYYPKLLRLIYRILFLLVIEERDLIFPASVPFSKREIYNRYYSLQRLRRLSEKRYLADPRKNDHWLSLLATFRLFESGGPGTKIGIAPLAGDLFSYQAIGEFTQCSLGNDILLKALRSLSIYQNPKTGQAMRVNYASLNVEEFGSVYEGLLEYEPVLNVIGSKVEFTFVQGDERSATGSHYTPDDLVQPLLKHSLDYLITDKLKEGDQEKALLSLRVADIACGSGHILLAAARRIAIELAIVRTGEEQPSPTSLRLATRDVIRNCIYGVDLNPLAVELCKVALWLEAHNPGEPLNFLDHHIKCGNAIVGFVHREELEKGVPDEAFATMPGDDKAIAAELRKRNKVQREEEQQSKLHLVSEMERHMKSVLTIWQEISNLPERTPTEIEAKKKRYEDLTSGVDAYFVKQVAAIPIAQFYIPKTEANRGKWITDEPFRAFLGGETPQGMATAKSSTMAWQKRFFHWFVEFPEIIDRGGFDCILGNPPYLGGQALSGTYGHPFCEYVKWEYAPTGLSDLVVYFLRRIFTMLKPGGFTAFITTNSIKDGDVRKDGLEQVLTQGGVINFAVRGIKWPGLAKLVVSLVALHRGDWNKKRVLDGKEVSIINAYFEDAETTKEPVDLSENAEKVFQGSIFLGDGFLLSHEEASRLIRANPKYKNVIFPIINGQELNNEPDQKPGRSIINFHDWSKEKAAEYKEPFAIVEEKVKPEREKQKDLGGKELWWRFLRPRMEMQQKIKPIPRCFAAAATTKYLNFSSTPTNCVFSHALYVFTTDRWDLYSVVQSTIHEVWARKYSGSLETRLRYSPSDCFETYPFPSGLWQLANPQIAAIGEEYHEHRRKLMLELWLGLTDIYNLFHSKKLTSAEVAKVSKKSGQEAEAGLQGILKLRELHRKLDIVVRDAYSWSDLDLVHDFYEVETLPENDRIRYTISPVARKELLKRLLAENHRRAVEEKSTIAATPKAKTSKKRKASTSDPTGDLFGGGG